MGNTRTSRRNRSRASRCRTRSSWHTSTLLRRPISVVGGDTVRNSRVMSCQLSTCSGQNQYNEKPEACRSDMQTIIEIIATHSDVEKDESRLSRFLEHREQGLPIFKHVPVDQSIFDLGINGNNNALQTTFKLQIHPSRLEHVDFALVLCDRRITCSSVAGCRRLVLWTPQDLGSIRLPCSPVRRIW